MTVKVIEGKCEDKAHGASYSVTLGFVLWKQTCSSKSWIGLRLEICPEPVTLEALSGNSYMVEPGAQPVMTMFTQLVTSSAALYTVHVSFFAFFLLEYSIL